MGRKYRWGIIAAAIAVGVGGGQFAFATVANDIFSDVPSTAADHDAINRVYQAGIMKQCATSPSLQFCPNQTAIRRGLARQYDYVLGLSGTPGSFSPTFRAPLFKNAPAGGAPFSVNSTNKVSSLNADLLDGLDAPSLDAAAAATGYNDPPGSTFEVTEVSITLDHPGRILAIGAGRATPSCDNSTPGCDPQVALYVDGAGIPASAFRMPPDSTSTYTTQGLTNVLAPGLHTIVLAMGAFSGSLDFASWDAVNLTATSVSAGGAPAATSAPQGAKEVHVSAK